MVKWHFIYGKGDVNIQSTAEKHCHLSMVTGQPLSMTLLVVFCESIGQVLAWLSFSSTFWNISACAGYIQVCPAITCVICNENIQEANILQPMICEELFQSPYM